LNGGAIAATAGSRDARPAGDATIFPSPKKSSEHDRGAEMKPDRGARADWEQTRAATAPYAAIWTRTNVDSTSGAMIMRSPEGRWKREDVVTNGEEKKLSDVAFPTAFGPVGVQPIGRSAPAEGFMARRMSAVEVEKWAFFASATVRQGRPRGHEKRKTNQD